MDLEKFDISSPLVYILLEIHLLQLKSRQFVLLHVLAGFGCLYAKLKVTTPCQN